MLKSSVRAVVTPPPVLGGSNVGTPSQQSNPLTLAGTALQQSLYLSVASSASESTNVVNNCRMRHITTHPALPWMAYVLEPAESKLSPHRQMMVQHYRSREVLWKLSLADLTCMMFEYDVHAASAPAKQQAALRALGPIQSLSFFDASTLHASGMVHQKTSSKASERHPRWQFLLVQFLHRSVMLNIRLGPQTHAMEMERRLQVPTVSRYPPFRPYVSQITSDLLKGVQTTPTTMALPITPTLLWVGCADGSLKVVDWVAEKVISTDKPSDKSTAAVRYLLAANPYNEPRDNVAKGGKVVKRAISVNKKGTAYMWEIVLQGDSLIDVRTPVVKMEGHFAPSSSSSNSSSMDTSSSSRINQSSSSSGNPTSPSSQVPEMEHELLDYCAHRDLFLWFVPTGYKGTSRPTVLCWDLSLSSSLKRKNKNKSSVPRQDPIVVSFPTLDGSGGGPLSILMGWVHPAFPPDALVCALVHGTTGLVDICAASLMEGKTSRAIPYFSTHLGKLMEQEAGTMGPPLVRASSIHTPRRLDTTGLLIGSNLGLIYLRVQEDSLGARHGHFGVGFGTEWGSSVLRVEHSSVVWSPLDLGGGLNPLGRLGWKKPQLVYTSPPCQSLPPEVQRRHVRLPPRFLPSPSGNFLCLYWPDETRYEILHLSSILGRKSSEQAGGSAVSTGEGILAFAWVGDDDVFALLHPPLEYRAEDHNAAKDPPSGSAFSTSQSVKSAFQKAKFFNRTRHTSSNASAASASIGLGTNQNDGSRFLPRVELRGLVGVSSNAAEMSGSIAAATAKDYGDIQLRSRTPATTLFGGPVLCVACKGKKGGDGGAAYFYTRKKDDDNNPSAKAYGSAGPTLPYPDFVEWDDDGRLVAVVVQGLVAVYLSQEPEFTLLGNVSLGSPLEGRDVKVTGVKFVHGVLFCTTATSVQCIFMGDYSEQQGICCLDAFCLASAGGPSLPQESFSLTPSTCPLTLNHPVVLGYQSGSLLVSTATDLVAVPMEHPLLRIGALLAAGQLQGASRWMENIPESSHEALASFLTRRGCPDLAVALPGVSLESKIDLALRHAMTDYLAQLVRAHGVSDLWQIDEATRHESSVGILGKEHDAAQSLVVCVGAYLLSQGKADLVQKMTQDLLSYHDALKNKSALVLASLLLALNAEGAKPLVQNAVHEEEDWLQTARESDDYPVVSMVRENVL